MNDRWEGASHFPGLVESFVQRIQLWQPECTGSTPMARVSATTQFTFFATWLQVTKLNFHMMPLHYCAIMCWWIIITKKKRQLRIKLICNSVWQAQLLSCTTANYRRTSVTAPIPAATPVPSATTQRCGKWTHWPIYQLNAISPFK